MLIIIRILVILILVTMLTIIEIKMIFKKNSRNGIGGVRWVY